MEHQDKKPHQVAVLGESLEAFLSAILWKKEHPEDSVTVFPLGEKKTLRENYSYLLNPSLIRLLMPQSGEDFKSALIDLSEAENQSFFYFYGRQRVLLDWKNLSKAPFPKAFLNQILALALWDDASILSKELSADNKINYSILKQISQSEEIHGAETLPAIITEEKLYRELSKNLDTMAIAYKLDGEKVVSKAIFEERKPYLVFHPPFGSIEMDRVLSPQADPNSGVFRKSFWCLLDRGLCTALPRFSVFYDSNKNDSILDWELSRVHRIYCHPLANSPKSSYLQIDSFFDSKDQASHDPAFFLYRLLPWLKNCDLMWQEGSYKALPTYLRHQHKLQSEDNYNYQGIGL